MTKQFSDRYPPKNRRTNALSTIEIQIVTQNGILSMDPNQAAVAAYLENLPLGQASHPSDLSGVPGYEYRTDEITLVLSREELYRFLRHDLLPAEYFTLVEKYGVFFEIHEDFYCEATGTAIQPKRPARVPVPPETAPTPDSTVVIVTSTIGDWVQVTRDDECLAEGHRITPALLGKILRTLGYTVVEEEKEPDEF